MKLLFSIFLLLSAASYGQSNQNVTVNNRKNGYTLEYPSEWDSAAFTQFKSGFKTDFGAIIKPGFNKSKVGGFFTLKMATDWGTDLNVVVRETEASFKNKYPDGKVLSSKKIVSKNKLPYHLFVTQVSEYGTTRVITQAQILTNSYLVILGFTILEQGYEALKHYFDQVIDSFNIEIP